MVCYRRVCSACGPGLMSSLPAWRYSEAWVISILCRQCRSVLWGVCALCARDGSSQSWALQHSVVVTPYLVSLIAVEQLKPLIRAVEVHPRVSMDWPQLPECYQQLLPARLCPGHSVGREQSLADGQSCRDTANSGVLCTCALPKCFGKLQGAASATCRLGPGCYNNRAWSPLVLVLPSGLRETERIREPIRKSDKHPLPTQTHQNVSDHSPPRLLTCALNSPSAQQCSCFFFP